MRLVVQKYGGTSVGTADRIKEVARKIASLRAEVEQMVVVISAMTGETARVIGLSREITPIPLRNQDILHY